MGESDCFSGLIMECVNPGITFESGFIGQLNSPDACLDADMAEGYLHAVDPDLRSRCTWRLAGIVSEGTGSAAETV